MDYTNYQNPSSVEPRDFFNPARENPLSVRTVEPNRSESESTEQRLYGAYRNTNRAVRELTPVSTPDAPLIYPFDTEVNQDIAQELNSETQPRPMDSIPMPNFITASRSRNRTVPELYTPLGDKTAPVTNNRNTNGSYNYTYSPHTGATRISTQDSANAIYDNRPYVNPTTAYPNLSTDYQMDSSRNMYLPRMTPYYNIPTEGYEDLNDFDAAERDMEYLRQLYPIVWQILQSEINEECDKLEYEGSCMFDEYPDKVTLDHIIHRIYERVKDYDAFKNYDTPASQANVSASQLFYQPCPHCDWVEDFTRILFLNEVFNRRRRHRNRRRWFY